MWEGINGFDSEGWAEEETVFKTWDPAAASELSRMTIVRSHLPVVNVRHLPSEAFKTGHVQETQSGSRPGDERMSRSPSQDDEKADHNANEVVEITDEEPSADGRGDIHHVPSITQNPKHSNGTNLHSSASHTSESDTPEHFHHGDLPQELILLMEQWTVQRGTKAPLPCSRRSGSWEKWFHRNEKGYNYVFRQVTGDKVTVRLVRLNSSFDGYTNRVVLVAEGPKFAPSLIRAQKRIRGGVWYRVWKGIRAEGNDGFEPAPAIVKAAPDAIEGIIAKLRGRPTQDDKNADHIMTGAIEFMNEESSADERDDTEHDPITPQNATHTSNKALQTASTSRLRPDDPQYFRQDLPAELKLLMGQWIIRHGTKEPFPCALNYSNREKWFKNDKGYDYDFRHINGNKVAPRVFKLGNFLGGHEGKAVIVAEGRNFDPCILRFPRQLQSPYGVGVFYHVWKGIRAKGDDGFDPGTPILKGAPIAIDGMLEYFRTRPIPEDIAKSLPPKHRKITLQYRKDVQKTSKREQGNVTYYPTRQPTNDPIADALPQKCEDLIQEWLRAHPEQGYGTLPCATTSADTFLNHGHGSGTPMIWKYKDGRSLQAQMYNLPSSSRPGKSLLRKRVIIVRGDNFGPCIVAHKPGPDATSLKGAAKIWLGVRGNKHGFEPGVSVYKTYAGDKQPTNGPRVPTPPYQRFHADDPEDDSSSGPRVKRNRPDLDAGRHCSTLAAPNLEPKEGVSRGVSAVPLRTLRPHLMHNLVCLFYAPDKPAPRIRLFNACDTPQKLFAQAMAGELFDPSEKSKSGSRVLRIRFGKSTPTPLVLVEGDENDFEALLEGVASSGCFTERKDAIEGSGSIEVRAAG